MNYYYLKKNSSVLNSPAICGWSLIVLWVCQWYFSEPIALLSYMSFALLAPLWVVRKERAVASLALHFIQFQQRQHCGFLFLFFFFHSWISLRGQDVLNGRTILLYLKAILSPLPAFVFRPFARPSFSQVRKSESRWWALFFPRSLSFLSPFFFCLLPFYTLFWINDMTLARQNSTMCTSYNIFSIWERERNLKYLTGQHFRPKNDLARLFFFLFFFWIMSI